MAASLTIRNMDGAIQFKAPMESFQLIEKGVIQTDTSIKIGNTSKSAIRIPVPSATSSRLIAVRAEFYVAKFGMATYDNQLYQMYNCETTSGQVEYYIFDKASAVDSPGPCLRLRDPGTGVLLYNSNTPIMNVASVLDMDVRTSSTLPSGRKYAVIQSAIGGHNESTELLYVDGRPTVGGEGDGSYHTYERGNDGKLYGYRVQDNVIACGTCSFDDVRVLAPGYAREPDPPTVWWTSANGPLIVLDVTNL